MIITDRDVYFKLNELLRRVHEVPPCSVRKLKENDGKHFCAHTRHFAIMNDRGYEFYIHYDAYTWNRDKGYYTVIGTINLYENFWEYETERMKRITEGPQLN